MNAISKDSGHLAWLAAMLGDRRHRLALLLQRLSGIGMPGALKPGLFRKFLDMLDQVTAEKNHETEIIGRIEAIEARHRFRRRHKALKYAAPEPELWHDHECENDPGYERGPNGWLWILGLAAFVSARRINQKKQGLAAD